MSLIQWVQFPPLGDDRGSLVALEAGSTIPFSIKRVYYIFATQGAFKPYIGLSLGVFLQTYAVKWTETYGQGIPAYSLDESFSASSFGIVPGVGAYYMLSSAMIQVAVEYNMLFSGIPVAEETTYTLGKVSGTNATTATDDDVKASSISFLLGVSFPIGGN